MGEEQGYHLEGLKLRLELCSWLLSMALEYINPWLLMPGTQRNVHLLL